MTQQSFFEGIKFAREGYRLQRYLRMPFRNTWRATATASSGSMSVTASAGGCTRAPEVPNFGNPGHGPRLLRGMTIAVEPMVNAGSAAIQPDA